MQTSSYPVLGHIHVPKCAGTSFSLLLDDLFPDEHVRLYSEPGSARSCQTTFVYSDAQLAACLEASSAQAFSSHFVRRFPDFIAGRRIYYVTFLRYPVRQFFSYLSYTRQEYPRIQDPVLLSQLPPNMPDLSLRDCARWLLAQSTDTFLNFRENYTTNFFARYEVQAQHGLDYTKPAYRRLRLNTARQVLRKFFFVGISEQMDDSWRLLRRKLASLQLPTPALPMRRENVSSAAQEDSSWLHTRDEVGAQVIASLQADLKLYRWARRRFELQLAEERQASPLRWWQKALV